MQNEKDIDKTLWGKMARDCWLQMTLHPRGTPNWDIANAVLHCLASMQFPVYDYQPENK